MKCSEGWTPTELSVLYAIDAATFVRGLSNRIPNLNQNDGVGSGDTLSDTQSLSLLPPERYAEHLRNTRRLVIQYLGISCSEFEAILRNDIEPEASSLNTEVRLPFET